MTRKRWKKKLKNFYFMLKVHFNPSRLQAWSSRKRRREISQNKPNVLRICVWRKCHYAIIYNHQGETENKIYCFTGWLGFWIKYNLLAPQHLWHSWLNFFSSFFHDINFRRFLLYCAFHVCRLIRSRNWAFKAETTKIFSLSFHVDNLGRLRGCFNAKRKTVLLCLRQAR